MKDLIIHAISTIETTDDFIRVVNAIKDTYPIFAKDIGTNGNGIVWYGTDIAVYKITYNYGNPFHLDCCTVGMGFYRPDWGK